MIAVRHLFVIALMTVGFVSRAAAQVLDKQRQLDTQTFRDNRDWISYAGQSRSGVLEVMVWNVLETPSGNRL